MKALQLRSFGSLDNLRVCDVAQPALPPDHVRIAIEAAAVNPSDVGVALGRFPQVTLPRILGRDFAGRVIEGPQDLVGRYVWGLGGGTLGITLDGTHAEQIVLPREALAERPENLSAQEAAAVGVPYVTAWSALVDLGAFAAGQWALVAGAAGAVGIAAVSLVQALNGRVIGIVRAQSDVTALRALGAAVIRLGEGSLEDEVRNISGGSGVDVALNGVGADLFAPLAASLRSGGRMIVYSVAGGRETRLDLFALYRRRLHVVGLDTASFDLAHIRAIYGSLGPLFAAGRLAPPRIAAAMPLSRARDAYESVQRGVTGKLVLLPQAA